MSDPQGLNAARARVLELAARLLVREFDEPTVEALQDPALGRCLDAYAPGCSDYVRALAAGGADARAHAATEFCALFITSRHTSPYASSWLGPEDPARVGAEITRAVIGWMDELGVEVAPGDWGNIPRDHIAVLLGLVALALLAPSPHGAALGSRIVARTLGWVPAFAAAVGERAQIPLYRAAARMAEHALDDLQRAHAAAR